MRSAVKYEKQKQATARKDASQLQAQGEDMGAPIVLVILAAASAGVVTNYHTGNEVDMLGLWPALDYHPEDLSTNSVATKTSLLDCPELHDSCGIGSLQRFNGG
eukprot:COSAG02_NODE_36_length_48934_cov_144.851029_29_plen_104_part_00